MCLFTHFAAGALAGGVTGNIYVGAATGLASHAVLDVIPHYDHPDWRVELAGGVFSLLLLLLMPFSTWPAVVGGLFGMAPDLENLFQKIGKMQRSQFIFPTHTGLLKHGRNLGPRSLGWQAAIFVGCFLLLGLLTPGKASAAEFSANSAEMGSPRVRLVSASDGRSVVRVDFPVLRHPSDWQAVADRDIAWALPRRVEDEFSENPQVLAPELGLALAVPTRQGVVARVVDVTWWRDPSEEISDGDLVRVGSPAVHRAVPIVGASVFQGVKGGVLSGITLEFQHQPSGVERANLDLAAAFDSGAKAGDTEHSVPAGILNPELFRMLSAGGRQAALARKGRDKALPYDPFALTTNWVKLKLTAGGLYRMTGQDLFLYGVPTGVVDPDKLRLYRGGGLALDHDAAVPDSLQLERVSLNEVAIEVLDGSDGEWNLDDEIRFYGVPTSIWQDRLETGADRYEFYDHPYAKEAVYWLTWESAATVSPLPGAPRRVALMAAPPTGGESVTTAKLRLHTERQVLDEAGVFADNWAWDNSIYSSRPENFQLRPPVAGSSADFVIDIRGVYPRQFSGYVFEAAGWLNDDQANQGTVTFSRYAQHDSVRLRIFGSSQDIKPELNRITLKNINNNAGSTKPLALDSYDIFYWADLDLTAASGQLEFAHWRDQVATSGSPVDLTVTAPDGEDLLLWDVSDPEVATIFSGTATGSETTFGFLRDPDSDRHFVAAAEDDLLEAASGSLVQPQALRTADTDIDYIVIHAPEFAGPARDLADFHATYLPGTASPRTVAVSTTDIYDNFSGGQKDALAIRNYLKYLFEQSGNRLRFACFLGNSSRDFRDYKNPDPDLDLYDYVPTELRTSYPTYPASYSDKAYAADDGLVSFDTGSWGNLDLPDLACGRLAASSLTEAQGLVDRAIRYSSSPEPGLWRNRVLFTADDCVTFSSWPIPLSNENVHTTQSERISNSLLPRSLDAVKKYGVAYDFPPSSRVKPALRADINNELSRGTTIFYYVGHGAEDNLADEQIFQSRDIANLTNDMMRPIFVAFSCDVGVFDSPSRLSMAEQFTLAENGGGIGSICASQVSFVTPNDLLSTAFFQNLFPEGRISTTVTPAEALLAGKNTMSSFYQANSQRYNLIGDPGMRLVHPPDDLTFTEASLDTLKAGILQSAIVDGAGSGAMLGAGDSYDLLVLDSEYDFGYVSALRDSLTGDNTYVKVPVWDAFIAPGAPVFAGTGTVGTGDLKVDFIAPTKIRYGEGARLRMIVESMDDTHTGVEIVPSVPSSTGPTTDIFGPDIGLGFEDNRYTVNHGTMLSATLNDSSSIAILGTTPGNSLLLEFDDSGFMTDVTRSFAFSPNSYTTGSLAFPLPGDLEMGPHIVALHASDALGNVGSDTLSFELAPSGVVGIDKMTLFPNPTAGPCRLLFEMSDPMEVQWEIYTLAGSRIRTIWQPLTAAGPRILEWDGRDGAGDEIANGTYLYVLRRTWKDVQRPGGEQGRDITKTGKLVIMR
jgi:hypothetical protein